MNKRIIALMITIIFVISGLIFFGPLKNIFVKVKEEEIKEKITKKKSISGLIETINKQNQIEKALLEDLNENKYSFEDPLVVLNPYEISPLTALIIFLTEKAEKVTIIVEGKDKLSTLEYTFSETKEHVIPVYGLYPENLNKIKIIIDNVIQEVEIETGPLPPNFILPDKVFANKNKLTNELLFVTPVYSGGHLAAYDVNGEPRWYLTEKCGHEFQLQNDKLIIANGQDIASSISSGLIEIDLNGKIYYEYLVRHGYHHDYFIMENGDLLIGSNNFKNNTLADVVALVDRKTGETKKTWDFTKIIPQDQGKMENWQPKLWLHINSVWYDKETNAIIVSGRHQDIVVSIDFDSSELNWLIGDPMNWSNEMQSYFFTPIGNNFEWSYAQHSAKILPNGDVFLFDNGNNRSKIKEEYVSPINNYSRGVIYRINPENMTIEQIWQYGKERGNEFYSPYVSNVEYYKENHYLIHSGGMSRLGDEPLNVPAFLARGADLKTTTVEILNEEVILEMNFPMNYYRGKKYQLYQDNEFKFGLGKILGEFQEVDIKHPIDKFLKNK